MKVLFPLLSIPLLLFGAASNASADDNVFQGRKAGVSVTKPSNWFFLEKNDLTDGIVAVLARHKEPYAGLNPSCRIRLTAGSAGKSAVQQAEAQITKMKQNFPDFTLVEGTNETTVGGAKGALFGAKYSLQDKGKPTKILWRMWFLPRSAGTVSIIMSGPQDGPEISEEQFKAILGSIKID